jgi:hypothetical protein
VDLESDQPLRAEASQPAIKKADPSRNRSMTNLNL